MAPDAAAQPARSLDHALETEYEEADEEWYASGEAELWDSTVGDGLDDTPRDRPAGGS
jgi:hypothetical protein